MAILPPAGQSKLGVRLMTVLGCAEFLRDPRDYAGIGTDG